MSTTGVMEEGREAEEQEKVYLVDFVSYVVMPARKGEEMEEALFASPSNLDFCIVFNIHYLHLTIPFYHSYAP